MSETNQQAEESWTLEVLFHFDTLEDAKAYMAALAVIEPAALFAAHIRKDEL